MHLERGKVGGTKKGSVASADKSWSRSNCGEFENCQIKKVSLDVDEGEVEDYYSLLGTVAHPSDMQLFYPFSVM